MNEMNKFSSMGMIRMEETCKDKIPAKKCSKLKKKGKCSDKKIAKKCKKTCELCDDGQGKIFRYNPSCFMSLGGFPVFLPRGNWVKCDKKYIYISMRTLELVQAFLPHLNFEIFWDFPLRRKNHKISIVKNVKMLVLILGYALIYI